MVVKLCCTLHWARSVWLCTKRTSSPFVFSAQYWLRLQQEMTSWALWAFQIVAAATSTSFYEQTSEWHNHCIWGQYIRNRTWFCELKRSRNHVCKYFKYRYIDSMVYSSGAGFFTRLLYCNITTHEGKSMFPLSLTSMQLNSLFCVVCYS